MIDPSPDDGATPEAAARAWIVRLASGEASEAELAALRAWRAASADHEQAFVAARTLWQRTGRFETAFRSGEAACSGDRAGRDAAAVAARPARRLSGLVAAGVALALLVPLAASQNWSRWFADHATDRGEIARVALPDGSIALLDSGSAIDFADKDGIRRVDLLAGAAWFEVAHDAEHPFEVHAGDGVATAVGTAFGVRRDGGDAIVSVTEGRVRVVGGDAATILAAGNEGGWEDGRLAGAHGFDSGKRLAWRDRRIVIEGLPLGAALDELERYRSGYVVLLDGDAASKSVSGVFSTERTDAAIDILARTQGLRVTRLTPWLTILS